MSTAPELFCLVRFPECDLMPSEVLQRKGFSFVEVISPCPTLYQRRNNMGDGLAAMKWYKEHSKTRHGPTYEAAMENKDSEIIVGKFVGRQRTEFCESMRAWYASKLGRIYAGGYATMTQNYGPEARGGAASSALVLSDESILYPYITRPDILVVMSQEAYTRFSPEVKDTGILIVEQDLVRVGTLHETVRLFSCPATRMAEELGRKVVLNVVMIGCLAAVSGILTKQAFRDAIQSSVPKAAIELNLRAFEAGTSTG